ncbi:transcriptional regulator [Amycolatopsis sp. NBRC 101858]|uniref:helix-turn-helix domain-containing protein n=1 Tax=Amycolatopsis sp. NBRC 101858 TaxID=3032200 RepID=UPI0024A25FEB|nr:helix-turn-helix transcriptional regulator [Amycolatopsis sp. NBRC 101858]GLY34326.1 transcriptional regulator [Amycolatopsis sp. NBRC 101858]
MLTAIREARENLSLTQREVADALDWSVSKIIRIERGTVGLSITDLKALLLHYGITDLDQVENYVKLAKAGRQRAWWDEYRGLFPPDFVRYLGLESAAKTINVYQFHLIPGLLQTAAYTRSLILSSGGNRELAERQVKVRRMRQARLDDPELEQCFILDESVLHRRVAEFAHWQEQLQWMLQVSRRSNITVRILPYTAGWVEGMQSSFAILRLSEQANDIHLSIERPDGDQQFADARGAEKAVEFGKIFARIEAAALPASETPSVIEASLLNRQ